MLLGQSPFRGEDEDEIYDAILAAEPSYPTHLPRSTVSILQGLLDPDPQLRLGSGPTNAQEIISHPFFHNINWEDVYHKRLTPDFQPQMSATDISNTTDANKLDQEYSNGTPLFTPVQSGKVESCHRS